MSDVDENIVHVTYSNSSSDLSCDTPAALADLSRYLEVARNAQEIAQIEPIVAELRSASVRVH